LMAKEETRGRVWGSPSIDMGVWNAIQARRSCARAGEV
jgi:hypothetical protein